MFCNESGAYVIYESDEHGFHNPKGLWDLGHVQIVALGDSFVQGYCVPSEKNFLSLIRQRYPATLNLGAMGNGPLAELATLKEYLPSLTPKIVLWCYCEGNDLDDLWREMGSALLRSYLRGHFTQGLLHRQAEIDQALTSYVAIKRHTGIPNAWEALAAGASDSSMRLVHLEAVIKLIQVRQSLGLLAGRSTREAQEPEVDLELFGTILATTRRKATDWSRKRCSERSRLVSDMACARDGATPWGRNQMCAR